jgi:tetratricopeptide (TPR) repeat protein
MNFRNFLIAWGVIALSLGGAVRVSAQDSEPMESGEAVGPSTTSRILRALALETPPGVRGDKAYRRGDLEEALRHYGRAAEETPPGSPTRPLLDLNIGNALYRQGRYPEATDAYEQALKGKSHEPAFKAKAHHNLGNVFYRKAASHDTTNPDPAIADLREALAHYKKALRADPKAVGTKQNLEMADAQLKQLLKKQEQQRKQQGKPPEPPEPSARAKAALARALHLAQERRYAEAASVLDDIMRIDRTASSFTAHRKRLDDVMKILRGERPDDPASTDPRATPFKPGAGRAP